MIGNKLEPFKFWCQKVLPNVYDDSLSYYEYLCKLNEYLNEVIGQINTLTDNMENYEADLTATWLETKEYIDNYFNNLDVQQEINNKLDQMAQSGTLSTLIAPFVSQEIGGVVADQIGNTVANQIGATVASQIDNAVAEQIDAPTANATNAWLTAHVNPVGSAVIVDNTLTISGAAADSKTVGDRFTNDELEISNINQVVYPLNYKNVYSFTTGKFIRPQDGIERDNSDFSALLDYIDISNYTYFKCKNQITIYFYASDYSYISYSQSNNVTDIPNNTKYMRLGYETIYANTVGIYLYNQNYKTKMEFDGTDTDFANECIPQNSVVSLNGGGELTQLFPIANLFDGNIIDEYYIRSQDGALRPYDGFAAISVYIDITSHEIWYVQGATVYFYDTSKTYLSYAEYFTSDTPQKITVPNNAKYMRFSWNKSDNPINILNAYDDVPVSKIKPNNVLFENECIPQNAVKSLNGGGELVQILKIKNIFDDITTDGYYIRTQDGTERPNSAFEAVLDYIDVEQHQKWFVKGATLYFYDSTQTYLSYAEYLIINSPQQIDIPVNAKYMRFSWNKSDSPINILNGYDDYPLSIVDPTNVQFKDNSIPSSAVYGIPSVIPSNITTVGNSNCKYLLPSDAVKHSDGTDTILVTRGEYTDYMHLADDTYGYKRTAKNIVGFDRGCTIIKRYGSAYADDVIHTGRESYIRNISFIALKDTGATVCGYALHSDNNWSAQGDNIIFENCYFYSDGRQSVGIGTRPDCNLIFRNCIFESAYVDCGAVFFHNSPDNEHLGPNQRLTFENCEFHAHTGEALHIEVIGDDTNSIELTVNNCLFYSDNANSRDIITVDKTRYTGTGSTNIHITNKTFGNNIDISTYIN